MTVLFRILGVLARSGVIGWALTLWSKRRKRNRQSRALEIVFENADVPPPFVTTDGWHNSVHFTVRRYRLGVRNRFEETVDHARLVVEAFEPICGWLWWRG
jgi:hypothetical protein